MWVHARYSSYVRTTFASSPVETAGSTPEYPGTQGKEVNVLLDNCDAGARPLVPNRHGESGAVNDEAVEEARLGDIVRY